MSDALLADDELPSQGLLVPFVPTLGPPEEVGMEESTALCLVGLLLVFLLFLLVRCFRILLDPYSRMPASSWSDHQDGLERGQFDYAVA